MTGSVSEQAIGSSLATAEKTAQQVSEHHLQTTASLDHLFQAYTNIIDTAAKGENPSDIVHQLYAFAQNHNAEEREQAIELLTNLAARPHKMPQHSKHNNNVDPVGKQARALLMELGGQPSEPAVQKAVRAQAYDLHELLHNLKDNQSLTTKALKCLKHIAHALSPFEKSPDPLTNIKLPSQLLYLAGQHAKEHNYQASLGKIAIEIEKGSSFIDQELLGSLWGDANEKGRFITQDEIHGYVLPQQSGLIKCPPVNLNDNSQVIIPKNQQSNDGPFLIPIFSRGSGDNRAQGHWSLLIKDEHQWSYFDSNRASGEQSESGETIPEELIRKIASHNSSVKNSIMTIKTYFKELQNESPNSCGAWITYAMETLNRESARQAEQNNPFDVATCLTEHLITPDPDPADPARQRAKLLNQFFEKCDLYA